MAIRGIKLTGKQPAEIVLPRRVHSLLPQVTTFNHQSQLQYQQITYRVHSADTWLHY